MQFNPNLETLPDFPFDRLRTLLDGIAPPKDMEPISLAVGEPQQPAPAMVNRIVSENAHLWNRYPPFEGSIALRKAIGGYLYRRYGLSDGCIDPMKNVLACAGTREALYLLPTWAVPGNRAGGRAIVAMPNPFYHVYETGALASGAAPLYLTASKETGFLPDLSALTEEQLERMAMMFLCSPANPQGTMADAAYLENAIRLARKHDFLLVVDECYAEIYDHEPPVGSLQVCRDMAAGIPSDRYRNVIAFHSLSKRSNGAGMRSGFLAGDAEIIAAHGRFRRYISATLPGPVDVASAALWNDDDHVETIRRFYRQNVDAAESVLQSRFGFYRPPGGFFLWLDVGDGEQAAQALWKDAGVRVLPGAHTARNDENGVNPGAAYIRVALVNHQEAIRQAFERLVKVL